VITLFAQLFAQSACYYSTLIQPISVKLHEALVQVPNQSYYD